MRVAPLMTLRHRVTFDVARAPATRKATPMNSPSQALVYALVASMLQIDDALFKDEDRLDELGLDALDLILLTIKLEELEPANGAFPLVTLARPRTLGDLVELADIWSQRDTSPSSMDGVPTQRSAS
jgi:hypothetical protein